MTDAQKQDSAVLVADLPARKAYRFDLRPAADVQGEIAQSLDLVELRKLRFQGTLAAKGRSAWVLEGSLGATAVQSCVVTLAPVVSRIDVPVRRLFTADYREPTESDEIEMPEDDTVEPLGDRIDLLAVATESLGLALPDYPRAEDAALENAVFAAPDLTPMTDNDVKPFAGLANLKAKLENPDTE